MLAGRAGDALLDSYESERRSHAQAMIDRSVHMKDLVSMTNPIGTRLRDAIFAVMHVIPATRRWLQRGGFKPRPVYRRGRYVGLPRRFGGPEGRLAPQPEVRLFNGRRTLLDEFLGDGFSLVGFNCDPREGLADETLEKLASIDARFVTVYSYGERPQGLDGVARDVSLGLTEVEDLTGHMTGWFKRAGFGKRGVAVLRPDKFTFAVVAAGDVESVVDQVLRQLHWQAEATVPGDMATALSA